MFRKLFNKLFKGGFSSNIGDFLVSLGNRLRRRGRKKIEPETADIPQSAEEVSEMLGFTLEPIEESDDLSEVDYFLDRFRNLIEEAMRKEVWITVGGVKQRTQKSTLGIKIINELENIREVYPSASKLIVSKLINAGILETPVDMVAVELDQYESQVNVDEKSDVLDRVLNIINNTLKGNKDSIGSALVGDVKSRVYADTAYDDITSAFSSLKADDTSAYTDARTYFGDDPDVIYAGDKYWGVTRVNKPEDNTVSVDSSEWYTTKHNKPITKGEVARENFGKTMKSIREEYVGKYKTPEEAEEYAEGPQDLSTIMYRKYYNKEDEE